MECLVCKRTGQKLFNINLCCGDGQNTIKADIIEFVGDSIADRLDDSQHVCNICMNMLDDIVKSKFKVLEAILSQNENKYVPNLGRFWTFIAKSYQGKFEDTSNDPLTPSLTPNTPPLPSRDVTPLLFVSKTKLYNEQIERNVERREGIKSELKRDYQSFSSRSKSNINKRTSRKEKKQARSKSADVKKMRHDIVRSVQSDRSSRDLASRPVSATSEMSFVSFTEEDSEEEKEEPRFRGPTLVYDGDEIVYPVKRTRSVSRSHERNLHEKEVKKKKTDRQKKQRLFECPYPHCTDRDFEGSLALFTAHMIESHHHKPYYKCWMCDLEFVTDEHLKMHLEKHDVHPVFCGMCKTKQQNVSTYQNHVEEHLSRSFKCIFCDLDFLSKRACNSHAFSNHKLRKIYDRVINKIVKKVHYKKPNIGNETIASSSKGPLTYSRIEMNLVINRDQRRKFRPRSFPEIDYLMRKRMAVPDHDKTAAEDVHVTLLGDDLVYNENLEESLGLTRKKTQTPSSLYREHGILPSWCNITSPSRGRRKWSPLGGRTTPFQISGSSPPIEEEEEEIADDSETEEELDREMDGKRLTRDTGQPDPFDNIPSDDEQNEVDMRNYNSGNWSEEQRRELESRNTELSGIFGSDWDGDTESVRELDNRNPTPYSDVGNVSNTEADSDVETENQYLDGNSFVSSINYNEADGNSSSNSGNSEKS